MTKTKKKTIFTVVVLALILAGCLAVDASLPSYHIAITVIKKATVYGLKVGKKQIVLYFDQLTNGLAPGNAPQLIYYIIRYRLAPAIPIRAAQACFVTGNTVNKFNSSDTKLIIPTSIGGVQQFV